MGLKRLCLVGTVAVLFVGVAPAARAEVYDWPIEITVVLPDLSNPGQTCTYNASGRAEVRTVNAQRDMYEFGRVTWRSSCSETIATRVRIIDTTFGPVHLDQQRSQGSRNSGFRSASANHDQTVNYRDSLGQLKPLYHARTIYIQYPLYVDNAEMLCVEVQWDVLEGDPTLVEPVLNPSCHIFPVAA